MHIDDWDESFLSKFSKEAYLENLKRAKVSYAMLYYQSHVGLCYYPTKTARMHKALIGREDEMRRLTDMCHENGISVMGYYSLIYNVWAHDTHPEWRMINENGASVRGREGKNGEVETGITKGIRYGLCCPNNKEYSAFVYSQIDEMLDYFTPDGLFFDMPFWPHPCHCESCKKRWKADTGLDEIPTRADFDDPLWRLFCERREFWMGEFTQNIADYVKAKNSRLAVEFNASSIAFDEFRGTGNMVNRSSDFCGGDLDGGLLQESITCKLYREITMNQPFEYMFPKCEPSLFRHTLTKTEEHIEAAVFLTAAHHGATMVIDAIDPIGTMDERGSDAIGKAFAKVIPYEKYFLGEPIADIAVAYGIESKGLRLGNVFSNHTAAVAFIENMIEAGISVGVVSKPRDFSSYKMIFAPCLWESESELCDALLKYANDGGTLYISGGTNQDFIEKATGCRISGMLGSHTCYFAPEKKYEALFEGFNRDYPLHVNGAIPLLEASTDVEVLARLSLPYTDPREKKFASIHSNPPGILLDTPTVIERKYGRGRIIYSAAPIENEEYIIYQRIIRNLIDKYVGIENLSITTDSPTDVETVSYRDENDIYISNVLLLDPKNKPYLPPFSIKVKSNKTPSCIKLLPSEEKCDFIYDGKQIIFTTKPAEMFNMYKIEF